MAFGRILSLRSPYAALSHPYRTAQPFLRPLLTQRAMATLEISKDHEKLTVKDHKQYETPDHLTPSNVNPSPIQQFHTWFEDVCKAGVREPEAVSLSTSTASGIPSSRMVLFKQLDAHGFVFYTNYTSRKSRELLENPNAALLFYWREVSRQVRVLGKVEKLTKEESEEYFKSRPVGSRLGAWASHQSSVVQEGELHEKLSEMQQKFGIGEGAKEGDVPLPEFWGGWRVIPSEVEFWLGKPSRLHDRVRYLRKDGSTDHPTWRIERLAP
ncbi:pyridoxamine 5'-phosphate oxidase [Coniophora puteana RWD-64-598 SS2]|uniref:pyridoxal 5'-phosphate synthase n=1 Tax=Coniophora puteana (strain RWD-64-598) TaxID=741705 RepID=A0A5M3MQI8_CONPW|nr:pyridoxamine 5'-phosphate oxidase [Coniophora puteana RWD-64-598 SS2]EIW80994.1 pyridoxamine 5'-phosphate oxidase [Coniophora puteana RWD-64-598 SS2]